MRQMETLKLSLPRSSEWVLRGAIIQLAPGGIKQTVDAKLNTSTERAGPANVQRNDGFIAD